MLSALRYPNAAGGIIEGSHVIMSSIFANTQYKLILVPDHWAVS